MTNSTVLRRILTLLLALALPACTSINRLPPTEAIDATSDAIVMLGVRPDHYRIQIFPGSVEEGVWLEDLMGYADFYGAADDGYVVARVESDTALAIHRLDDTRPPSGKRTEAAFACSGTRVVVFTIPKGKVLYLSDFEFGPPGERFKFRETADLARAMQWLDQKYPALRGRLEQGTFEVLPAGRYRCQDWPFGSSRKTPPEPTTTRAPTP